MTDRHAKNVNSDDNRDKNTNLLPKTSPFTKEQLDILQKLFNQSSLSQSSTPASGSWLLAQKGQFSKALTVSTRLKSMDHRLRSIRPYDRRCSPY